MKKNIGFIFAFLLKQLFRIKYLQKFYFGIYKKIIVQFNLFQNVQFNNYKFNNFYLNIHLQDWIQQQIFLLNGYEKSEMNYLSKNGLSINTFLDIGANIGLYSLHLASINKNCKIYSFEPLSLNYNQLVSNVNLNNFANINIYKYAIGDQNISTLINYSLKNNNLGEASINDIEGEFNEIVQMVTLDSFFEKEKIKIDFIKLDIEGNELNALLGMDKILKKCKPTILIEMNVEIDLKKCKEVDFYLKNLGYIANIILSNGDLLKNVIDYKKNNNYIYTN